MERKMPLICISGEWKQMDSDPRRMEAGLYGTYAEAVCRAGGLPIPTCGFCAEELAELCDALLLSGGADLDPTLYGEEILNDTVKIHPQRDAFEVELFHAFLRQKKPVFGICRGCQIINVLLGGTLYQDLAAQKGWNHQDAALRHEVTTASDSLLHRLFGERFLVNSTHHQSVRAVAPGLRVTACSAEGVVEAVEHELLPIFAVQFHPERLTGILWDDRTPDFLPLFQYFIKLAKK